MTTAFGERTEMAAATGELDLADRQALRRVTGLSTEHLKVQRLLQLERIGMSITGGYAPEPEQSTLALVAHHPQAIYFGTSQGRLLANGSPDDLIRGSARDPSLFGELDDEEPPDGAVEAEDAPAMSA